MSFHRESSYISNYSGNVKETSIIWELPINEYSYNNNTQCTAYKKDRSGEKNNHQVTYGFFTRKENYSNIIGVLFGNVNNEVKKGETPEQTRNRIVEMLINTPNNFCLFLEGTDVGLQRWFYNYCLEDPSVLEWIR